MSLFTQWLSVPEGKTHNKCQCRHVAGWQAVTGTSLCLGITSHFALEPEVRAENEQGPKQNKTKKSITERCINQFCVEKHPHHVTAHCAVVICTEMDSDCHKLKPWEET